MAKKKSGFYHARWNRCGLNVERAAEVLGVTVEDVMLWDVDGNDLAERFLLLWDRKHVGVPGWDGWCFSRGVLRHGRKQWRPETILAAREQDAEVSALRAELRKLYSLRGAIRILKASFLNRSPQ